jgi:Asp-tRNA(Asn)/Glu-tRNA(Gln) amidotransferase A subunit family amidase
VGLRICLVTPFPWSKPHDVNEHVAGAAAALRDLGHEVSILAPSNRAADLLAGRRALQDGASRDVIALGPAVPISRRSKIGLPVGVMAGWSKRVSDAVMPRATRPRARRTPEGVSRPRPRERNGPAPRHDGRLAFRRHHPYQSRC